MYFKPPKKSIEIKKNKATYLYATLLKLTSALPTEYTSNELLADLQRIYRLKAIINDYGNKAVRDIQNPQKITKKRRKK